MRAILLFSLLTAFLGCSSPTSFGRSGEKIPVKALVALRDGTFFELFSLDPSRRDPWPHPDGFRDWRILGSTAVDSQKTRTRLLDALAFGVGANQIVPAVCFNPRYGIRVQHQGKQHDFVICFECNQIEWYTGEERNEGFLVTDSPKLVFDRVLRDFGVELADTAK